MGATALLSALVLSAPTIAVAEPSQDDIDQAKQAEDAAQMSVSDIEVELASVSAQAQDATQAALAAGEDYNAAQIALQEATDTATQAKADSDQAQADYETARQQLASVAQTAYREGSTSVDPLAPYVESDGLSTVEQKQSLLETVGSSADARLQKVAALKQVSDTASDAADQAQSAQADATQAAQDKLDTAQAAADSAAALQTQTQARHQVLVEELAKRQNTTADLIEEKAAADEQQREAAAQKQAEKASDAQVLADAAAGTSGSTSSSADAATTDRASDEPSTSPSADSTPSTGNDSTSTTGQNNSTPTPSTDSESESEPAQSTSEPAAESEPAQSTSATADPEPEPASSSGSASGAVAFAEAQVGKPYVFGAAGPNSYDCSGLVTAAYASQGIHLSHQSSAQYQYNKGTKVSLSSIQPGDLLFWDWDGDGIDHVAIYIGNGQMVEAPAPGYSVRIVSVYGWSSMMPYAVRIV